jgi:hypothetical protein
MSAQTYEGSCQCGAVRYEVTADLGQTTVCNCSRCRRLGWIMTFVPEAQFKLLAGEDATTEYQFNKHVIHHHFCRACGIQSFSRGKMPDGTPVVAINVRCLDGVDLDALTPQRFDGKSV